MSTSVVVKQQVLIPPSDPTPNHILQLSALDSQPYLRVTSEVLLVYKPCDGVDRDTIIDNVKSGLGRALVPYYPLAGRVRARADGSGLEVDCWAQGALFIETVSNSSVPEFEGAPKNIDEWRKLLSFKAVDVLAGDPLFVLQLTWLSDGGLALAVAANHHICDGTGLGQFLNSIADLARGNLGFDDDDKPKPIWSRHLLDPVSPAPSRDNSLNRHPEYTTVADVSGFTSRYVKEQLIPTSIVFDKDKINKLKKLTESTHTSFEVLSAHIWRCWVRALNLASNQKVKLVFTVNIRNRVNPSLPSGYYGNAFVYGCAVTSVGELIKKGLGYAAELVKRAKERVGDEYVREVVSQNWVNVDSVCALIMTQLSRVGFDVDFGIGKPVHVGPVCPSKNCKLYPVYSAATSVNVVIAVLSNAVDQYLYLMENISA